MDVVGPEMVPVVGVDRVDAAARVGEVHDSVDDHRRGLVADPVDDAVLEEPARCQQMCVLRRDLVDLRVAAAVQIEVVQAPVDVLGQRGGRDQCGQCDREQQDAGTGRLHRMDLQARSITQSTRDASPLECSGALATGSSFARTLRKSCCVPNRHDPNDLLSHAVEEAVRTHDHFAVGKIRELRHDTAGFGIALESAQDLFRPPAEPSCGLGILTTDVRDRGEKLRASCRRETDDHELGVCAAGRLRHETGRQPTP